MFKNCVLSSKTEILRKTGRHVVIKKSQYSFAEVVEITNNFQTEIGKGGFGMVYHGHLKDGTQVAIKMLSPSSSQGPREFQTEVCDICISICIYIFHFRYLD